MRRLLPEHFAVSELEAELPSEAPLPEEVKSLGSVVKARYLDFSRGRQCAHSALRILGAHDVTVPCGDQREPVWPDGFIGSITHCPGYCAAAVARCGDSLAVGIDAEVISNLSKGTLDLIVSGAAERALVESVPESGALLFSAKESIYKAWFPLTGKWLGFQDVRVDFKLEAGTFEAELLLPPPVIDGGVLSRFQGRYLCTGTAVLTSVVIDRSDLS